MSKRRAAYIQQQICERVDASAEAIAESRARWTREDAAALRQGAAAARLQALCRAHLALRELAHLRAVRCYRAVTRIQARVRCWIARRRLVRAVGAAVRIQAAVRLGWGGYVDVTRRLPGELTRWQWWYHRGNLPPRLGGGAAVVLPSSELSTSETPEHNSGRGQRGVFFDCRSDADTSVQITSLVGGGLHGAADVRIYARDGSGGGKELSEDGWRVVGEGCWEQDRSTALELAEAVTLQPRSLVGFYVHIVSAGKRVFRRGTHTAYVTFSSEGALGSVDAACEAELSVLRGRYSDAAEPFGGVGDEFGGFAHAGSLRYTVQPPEVVVGSGGADSCWLRPPSILVERWWRVVRGGAVHVQAAWRQWRATRRVRRLRRRRAATWLQSVVRTYNAKRKYAFLDCMVTPHITRVKATVKLQRAYRRKRALERWCVMCLRARARVRGVRSVWSVVGAGLRRASCCPSGGGRRLSSGWCGGGARGRRWPARRRRPPTVCCAR